MYSGIPIKASKTPEKFRKLPLEGQFRKRDVDVFDEDDGLFGYFREADALEKVDFDDDANVTVWVWKTDVQEFLQEAFGE